MTEKEILYDVQVVNAYKSYGKTAVFNGLNMNVTPGSIYGLLGPSGCGKSTLIRCILGIMKLDSGTVHLKAKRLKSIGFMSQDLCLEQILTVDETFEFYGSLYKMSKKQIENRKHELHAFLQLPITGCLIQYLSGGESKRVSLAITLLHDPEIIILDEPTVGIDSVLRYEIWSQFIRMAKNDKKTIIITTHYIEEANQADCIGFMRNGVISEEGSPRDIISKFNSDSLENAFLSVCYNQEKQQAVINTDGMMDSTARSKNLMQIGKKINRHRVKALMRKNIRVLLRDNWLLFFAFFLPILQAYIVSVGFGNNIRNLKIAYKNDEISCQNYSSVGSCIYDKNSNQTMSCDVMRNLESHGFALVQVKDQKAAEKIMKDKTIVAFIYFPNNYTNDLVQFIDDFENYQAQAYVYLNNNYFLESNQIQTAIINSMNELKENISNGCSMNPKAISTPINFITLLGKDVKINTHYMVGFFLVMGSFYYSSIFSVIMMLSEKMDGVFSRSMLAGVTVIELLTSMFCLANILILIQSIVPLIITYMVFSNPIQITSGLFMCAITMIIAGWQGFFFGLIAAGITPTKSGGVHIMNGLAIAQMLVSGGIWPLEAQAPCLKAVTQFLPMTVAGKMMTSVTLRGWEWNHPLVLTYFSTLCVHVVLMVLALIFLGRFKKDTWILNK
ncbi:ABC transporter G family member 23-like [Sipha flava]|uniref:ABC transporter G family member 23-like n=1 Tax=Sipha flava TaxID=143950 RepID=A0A8B8GFC2_9HEMI|nr:ABC transporter G family member 23-like [Sipha flava]